MQRLAKCHNLSLDEIHKKLTGGWARNLLMTDVKNYVLKSLQKYALENIEKEFAKSIPVIGLGLAAMKAAMTTDAILNNSLEEMLTVALSIVDLIK